MKKYQVIAAGFVDGELEINRINLVICFCIKLVIYQMPGKVYYIVYQRKEDITYENSSK